MPRSLLVRIDLPGIVSGVDQKLNGTAEVAATLEMHRQLRGHPWRAIAEKSDNQIPSLAVQ